ncbi:MAG: hypothetical protein BWK78_03595, partial [Thiotrichaceae bacterium IS1]
YAGDKLLAAKIAVNIVQVLTEQQKCTEAETKFNKVLPQLKNLPDSHDKAFTLIGLAAQFTPLFTSLLQSSPEVGKKKRCSLTNPTDPKDNPRWSAFNEALRVATSQRDKTAMAYAEGYLAQLYIEQNRYDEAKQLTRQAIFHSQESADSGDLLSAPAPLFRWEWQLGKLFDLQQKGEDAIGIYRQAAKHLEITKKRCGGVSRAFLKEGEDFYYEYAELLYRQYPKTEPAKIAELLEELTDIIESFKTTQLQNYFYTECADDLIEKTKQLRRSQNNATTTTKEIFADEKFSFHPTLALYSPFVFASSVVQNISSLPMASYFALPSFREVAFSLAQNAPLSSQTQNSSEEDSKEDSKFDRGFFSKPQNQHTAVLYLLMLDKTEPQDVVLILNSLEGPQWIKPGCSPCSELKDTVEKFRDAINAADPRKRGTTARQETLNSTNLQNFLGMLRPHDQNLYNWLIAPAIPTLERQNIDTLVLVPSSVLQILPFAALQNDHGMYLIEKYALVITPAGSQLTDFETKPKYENALLAALSQAVSLREPEQKDFDALEASKGEVDNVGSIYPTNEKLVDDSFTIEGLKGLLDKKSYSIVHLSTHGVFRGEQSEESYLLTFDATKPPYDKVLTINELGKIVGTTLKQENKVELLSLSACESAVSDNEQGGLGLIGVGINAGARSAVGTLWQVNDFSTTVLMIDFYQNLKGKPPEALALPKAKALQNAQKRMLNGDFFNDKRYRHPLYWAAFVLSGNWF